MTRQLSRREFLKRGVVVAGGAGLLGSSSRVWAAPRSDFGLASNLVPAVVIGSGFGGSVAALRLGLAGIDTVVLERGRRWPIRSDGNTFATFEQPDGRAYWLRDRTGEAILGLPQLEKRIDRYVGVLEVVEGNGIVIGAGAGVGGGSLVFNAIIVKPLRDLFERVFPRQIDFDEMEDVYYPRVKEIIRSADPRGHPGDGVLPLEPREPRPGKDGGIAHAPGRVGRGLGHRPRRDRGTDGGVRDRGPVVLRSQQRGQAQPRSQLPCPGEATGHVEVLPLHQAVAIERDAGRYVVTTIRLREDGTADGEPRRLLCKHLFLAAGSIGTTSLLVRARATRALALNDDVGCTGQPTATIPSPAVRSRSRTPAPAVRRGTASSRTSTTRSGRRASSSWCCRRTSTPRSARPERHLLRQLRHPRDPAGDRLVHLQRRHGRRDAELAGDRSGPGQLPRRYLAHAQHPRSAQRVADAVVQPARVRAPARRRSRAGGAGGRR
jgi:cholesterol oxidase